MSILDTLKAAHQTAEHAKAKIAEATAIAEDAVRHIEAIVPALTDVEKAAYADFLKVKGIAAKL